MNYVEGEIDLLRRILTIEDIHNWKAHPRPIIEIVESEHSEEEVKVEEERPPSPWEVVKSYFFTPTVDKQDSPDLLKKCFEFDWKCSKLERIFANSGK